MPLTRNQTSAAAQSKAGGAEAAESSTAKETTEQGGASSESDPPRRDSPDNCSICLGPFINKSFTNSCAHSFCFVCLKQWSKVKAECPLCKQPFFRIFHNIRSSQMYDTYELPRQPPNQVNQYNIYDYGGGFTTFTAPTHHYLSLPQPFDADLTLSNFSRFQFRHRRYDRYLNPLSIQGEHQYSYTNPALRAPGLNGGTTVSAASWPRGPEDFRRHVYRHNIGPPVVILGNENSTYRLTPAMVAASSHRLHRIMPWLTRELRVLLRSTQNVRLAVSMIQPLLTQVSIDSVYFQDRVATLLGRRSRVFIQEFLAFANSALSMQAFDRKAMYNRHDETVAASSPSSSTSSENDVEIVSPDPVVMSTVAETQTSSSQPLDLRRSGWDSPTPGPSWGNLNARDPTVQAVPIDRVSVSSESDDPVYIPNLRDSESEHSRAGSDIIFVKYDKPWEERSPIQLTDSEKEAESERVKKKKKSKHKRKRKHSLERNELSRKDKSHKSSKGKSHGRDKSKSSSKGESGEERTGSSSKRHPSLSSPEVVKTKRRKKSKEKRDKSSDANRDRELVDRLFAETFAQQKGHASSLEEKTGDSPRSGKGKERSHRSYTKDRSKKKKKSKNHSRGSSSPSFSHSFKKHPSGHKKSSNAARHVQTSSGERSNAHHNPSTSLEGENGAGPSGRSSRRDSLDVDQDTLNQPPAMTHSVAPGFQPPYLPLPDTVQHIPVNLWVSTWPALPVSHPIHPRPSSSNPPGSSQSVPQSSNLPALPSMVSPHSVPGPSTAALDLHTVSSDSSTEYDSEDPHDRQVPSLKNVDSRTMHWLETHCPDLGRIQPKSLPDTAPRIPSTLSTSSTSPSSTSSSETTVSHAIPQPQPIETVVQTAEKETEDSQVNVEVVSIGSGDEDIVICSSSSDSDPDEIHCLEEEPPQLSKSSAASMSKEPEPTPSTSKVSDDVGQNMPDVPFIPDFSSSLLDTSAKSSLFIPSGSKPFQPFKLQRKSALTHQGKDPFFPSMSHSSDEDEDSAVKQSSHHPQYSHLQETSPVFSQGSKETSVNTSCTLDLVHNKIDTPTTNRNEEQCNLNLKFNSVENRVSTVTVTQAAAYPTSTFSSSGPSMFLPLPSTSQTTLAPSVSSTVLHSSLNYLPYSTLPSTSTSLPSILSQPLSFSIPTPTPQQPSLPLNFSFPPITSMLPQAPTHSLLHPIGPPVSQGSSITTTFTTAQQTIHSNDNGTSFYSQPDTVQTNSCLDRPEEDKALGTLDNTLMSSRSGTGNNIPCQTQSSASDNLQNGSFENTPIDFSHMNSNGDGSALPTTTSETNSVRTNVGNLFSELPADHYSQQDFSSTIPERDENCGREGSVATGQIMCLNGEPSSMVYGERSFHLEDRDYLDEDSNSVSVPEKKDEMMVEPRVSSRPSELGPQFQNMLASLDSMAEQNPSSSYDNTEKQMKLPSFSPSAHRRDAEGGAENLLCDFNTGREFETDSGHMSQSVVPNGQELQEESQSEEPPNVSESSDINIEGK